MVSSDPGDGLELAHLIDVGAIQAIMDDFYNLTHIGVAVVDIRGRVLVATGWQDVCTKFHRVNPASLKNCIESDTRLSSGVRPGTFRAYRCKNGMWDIATPLVIEGAHLGNVFLGQFFYEDETPDHEFFRRQARLYGFDEAEYLNALERVPRWSRSTVNKAMSFYAKFATLISTLSYSRIKLTRALEEGERATADLRNMNLFLDSIIENIPNMLFLKDANELRFVRFNKAGEDLLGYSRSELLGKNDYDFFPKEQADFFVQNDRRVLETKRPADIPEEPIHTRDKGIRILHTRKVPVIDAGCEPAFLLGISEDITERVVAEKERLRLQQELLHSQKIESIGRLAGGVAHDFNNMLGVILGHAEMALERVKPEDPVAADLEEIRTAARRSAELTKQLLAFGRRQTTFQEPVDVNELVTGLLAMLRRIIGEHIELVWVPGREVWPALVDRSQLEQVLVNLCVNARDAIGKQGTITIVTSNRSFDEVSTLAHPDCLPMDYVSLSVRDDGCGMTPEVLSHVFEPFFTTKDSGRGTGLGLSSVYGAVRQNGGFVTVSSEPGKGSEFSVYLPRAEGRPEKGAGQVAAADTSSPGREGVLLVEDEPAILAMVTRVLERKGYKVVGTTSPLEALRLARERQDEIQILVTDVVMPQMNGRELAERLQAICPRLKCLFMSGYSADVISEHGVLETGVSFIEKPFSTEQLTTAVRTLLDTGSGEPRGGGDRLDAPAGEVGRT